VIEPVFADVRAAALRLRGVAHRTPVVTSRTLDARTGASVFLKCENLQRMGAFKFRGAYNRLVQLGDAERAAGVVAFSSGNHAQGVALAAQLLGIAATIVMPDDAPAAKVAATREYGAEIVFYDRGASHRDEIASSIAHRTGATLVPPFDDPAIVAGQGTVALELIEDVPGLDVLLVCTGGGGLLAGSALAAASLEPDLAVYGVEPEAGDDFARSFAAGRRVEIPVPETIADGQRTTAPGELTFPIVKRLCAGILTVSDGELCGAMRFAFERLKLVVEPSGASALAAVLGAKLDVAGRRVGVILSGGNVDGERYASIVGGRAAESVVAASGVAGSGVAESDIRASARLKMAHNAS
jgi:threonine dehydratase